MMMWPSMHRGTRSTRCSSCAHQTVVLRCHHRIPRFRYRGVRRQVIGEIFHPAGSPAFNSSGASHVKQEDPTIWRDKRGRFHNLDHGGRGHGFSEDGISWRWVGPPYGGVRAPAYGNSVRLDNGTVVKVTDVERPKIWVNPGTGQPELLFFATGGPSGQPIEADGFARGFTVVQRINTTIPSIPSNPAAT